MKKTLHQRDLGCTSTFLTLSVMLRFPSFDFRRGGVRVLHVGSELSLSANDANATVFDTDVWGGRRGVCVGGFKGNGSDF